MVKIASGFVFGAVMIFALVLASGYASVSPPAENTTPSIVYVTVFVTPTPTLPPVNTNIMGAVGYITPRPTLTFDPSKYVQPWLGYEDSSGSGYIDNNGNTAAAIYRHETSLGVNTTPKEPTYSNGNAAAAIYRRETSLVVNTAPIEPTSNTVNTNELNAGRDGPDWAGQSVYAAMTKDELAAPLKKSGTFYRDGTVSAWTIKSDRYSGTIEFQAGYGVASVDGYPQVTFSWNEIGDNHYEAHYLWYTVQFTYNPEKDTLISPLFPDAKLER